MKDRRTFSPEFKCEAAALVVERGYSIAQACEAMGVGKTAMQRWVHQLISERGGITPVAGKALTPEQQRIQELEALVRKIEREKNILKEATALLMSESFTRSK
jgi:transposase